MTTLANTEPTEVSAKHPPSFLATLPCELISLIAGYLSPTDLFALSWACSRFLHPARGYLPDAVWQDTAVRHLRALKLPHAWYPNWRTYMGRDLLRHRVPHPERQRWAWTCRKCHHRASQPALLYSYGDHQFIPDGWAVAPHPFSRAFVRSPDGFLTLPFTLPRTGEARSIPITLSRDHTGQPLYLICRACFYEAPPLPAPESFPSCHLCGSIGAIVERLSSCAPPPEDMWAAVRESTAVRTAYVTIKPTPMLDPQRVQSPSGQALRSCQNCLDILVSQGYLRSISVSLCGDTYIYTLPDRHDQL